MENDRTHRAAQDRLFFMRRAAQERSAADHAAGDKARKAHQAMAEHYQDLVHAADETPHVAA